MSALPASSKALNLKTTVSVYSSVKPGQLIYENNLVTIREHGFFRGLLSTFNSIKVESTGCTKMTPSILRQVDDGIVLKVTATGILGCPYSPFVRIVSTTKSPRTKVSSSFLGREMLLSSASTVNAYENIQGDVVLGSSAGQVTFKYKNSTQIASADYYVKSPDNNLLTPPLVSPEPYLDSVGFVSKDLYRVCTNKDNNITSKLNYKPKLIKGNNCLDTTIADSFLIQSPRGYKYYRFDA